MFAIFTSVTQIVGSTASDPLADRQLSLILDE